jgi:ketosteroid isomerase-like protein
VPDSNIEIVKRGFETLATGDVDALIPFLHPDFEMTTTGDVASEPDTYRGVEGMRRYWASFYEIMEEIRVEPLEFIAVGELVVVPSKLHARGKTTQIEASQSATQVWELRDELALRVSFFPELEDAMAFARERAGEA